MTVTIDGTTGIASVDGSAGSPSVRGSDANSGIVYDSDTVAVSTAGSERARVDSSGRLLLGTTTEGHEDAEALTIASTGGYTGITLRSDTNKGGAIYFSDATSGAAEYDGQIVYSQNSQSMVFATAQSARLTIDSSGNVTTPNNPFFLAKGTAAWTEIAYGSGGYQNLPASVSVSNVGAHYNTSTYRFTAPVAGRYMFQSQVYWKGDSNGVYWSNYFTVNGSSAQERHQIWSYGDAQYEDQTSDASIVLELSANDYVAYLIRVEQVNADIYGGHCYFSGFLIG